MSLKPFAQRREYSEGRLEDLKAQLSAALESISLENLSIYTVGSYGRLEASKYSDIDLFFVYSGEVCDTKTRRVDEIRIFGQIVHVAEGMQFPAFDRGGAFLQTHTSNDILATLGGPEDDHRNYFTARMLMLLEGRPLHNEGAYDAILASYVEAYMRDYHKHSDNFHFTMLFNDISRYWKTLTLNYEHKRNSRDDRGLSQEESSAFDRQAKVKNFKLKFSRLLTCFSYIAAVSARAVNLPEGDDPAELALAVARQTPQERLLQVKELVPSASRAVDEILDEYGWFMEMTGLPTSELEANFIERESKRKMFERADRFSDLMFELIQCVDGESRNSRQRLVRYLAM